MASIDERLVDKRIVERNIERGVFSKADFESYLNDLPDIHENAEVIRLRDGGEGESEGG